MKSRWIDIAVALAAASLFATAVWGGNWWTLADVSIGPLGSRQCFGANCRGAGLNWIGGSAMWERGASATWAAGLISMVVLIGLAAATAANRVPIVLARTALVAIATAFVAGAYFVIAFPGVTGASIGYGAVVYGGAIALGATASIRVLRWKT